jgi:hypothetical protein
MIISVEKAKSLVSFPDSWTDEKIKMKLLAVEQTIRAYTNNNFQNRGYRLEDVCIRAGVFMSEALIPFNVDDTVQVSESRYNSGLFTVSEVEDLAFMVNEDTRDEDDVLVTKIEYPADVIDCCVNLIEWEVNNRGKVGIKSETLSRHSVTYEDSASMFRGYPKGILSAVSHYRKVRC